MKIDTTLADYLKLQHTHNQASAASKTSLRQHDLRLVSYFRQTKKRASAKRLL